MPDAIKDTASGATRDFLGAVGFVLVMEGIIMTLPKEGIQCGLGVTIIILGAIFFFAGVFWRFVKRIFSDETQKFLAGIAQSSVTKPIILGCFLIGIILSPFIEQRRWPFSHPADPKIYQENEQLRTDAKNAQAAMQSTIQDASKWRFSYNLRYGTKAPNGELADCKYVLRLTQGRSMNTWIALQPMLELAHWQSISPPNVGPSTSDIQYPSGITILAGADSGLAFSCASSLGNALGGVFRPLVSTSEQTKFLQHFSLAKMNASNSECQTNNGQSNCLLAPFVL